MELREALYTTRAMRRVSSEPIPLEVQERIFDAAIRAPSGGNSQGWRFLLVDDRQTIAEVAPLYREAIASLWATHYKERLDEASTDPDAAASVQFLKMHASANWLAEHFESIPLLFLPFTRNDPGGGSIYPAVWSAMLAARAEGVGSCLTSVLSGAHHDEVLALLDVPLDRGWRMAGCVSLGYPTGRWGVAQREPVGDVTYRNRWGRDAGFSAVGPLWEPPSP
jgi:nitroreductase